MEIGIEFVFSSGLWDNQYSVAVSGLKMTEKNCRDDEGSWLYWFKSSFSSLRNANCQ